LYGGGHGAGHGGCGCNGRGVIAQLHNLLLFENVPKCAITHFVALLKCANVRSHILLLFENVRMCNCLFHCFFKMCVCAIAHFVAL